MSCRGLLAQNNKGMDLRKKLIGGLELKRFIAGCVKSEVGGVLGVDGGKQAWGDEHMTGANAA